MIHTDLFRTHRAERWLCSVDPITLTGLAVSAIGGLAGAAAGGAFSGSSPAAPTAQTTPAPAPAPTPQSAPPASSPMGARSTPRPQQQTFIGAAATPPTQSGQHTLLGQ